MKRIVGGFWSTIFSAAVATLAVAAATGASAGATYLIALGFLVIAFFWLNSLGLLEDEPKARTGEGRSRGSR